MKIRYLFLITILVIITYGIKAQIQTNWIDTTTHKERDNVFFFTNRPMKYGEDSVVIFKNKYARQSGSLYFCLYNYEKDTIYLKYQASKICGKKVYPRDKVERNIFYKIYEDLRLRKSIKRFVVIVPGYSKTFNKQIHNFIRRTKTQYADTLNNNSVFLTFAWGNEWRPPLYYRAKRSAKRAANDFSIFQHMLEEFVSDSVYFDNFTRDISINLICSSMGNQLLKKYLLKREKQGIKLVKCYDRVIFSASDASWDSFEMGKGFHNIEQMTDTVGVWVNRKDITLKVSQGINPKKRMGLVGPKNPETLPAYVKITDITAIMRKKEPGLGHDYFLANPTLRDTIIKYSSEN